VIVYFARPGSIYSVKTTESCSAVQGILRLGCRQGASAKRNKTIPQKKNWVSRSIDEKKNAYEKHSSPKLCLQVEIEYRC
jgi:hypothetical protein